MANFFDKMVVGINKGVNSVSEGSKILVEKAKLSTQLQEYEKQKNQMLQNIGALVYNLQASGEIDIPQSKGMCDEVTALNEKIKDLEVKIRNLDANRTQNSYVNVQPSDGIVCSCGCVNVKDAKFCAGCGKPLSETPVPVAGESIICECGAVNKPTAKFCVGCGKQLG